LLGIWPDKRVTTVKRLHYVTGWGVFLGLGGRFIFPRILFNGRNKLEPAANNGKPNYVQPEGKGKKAPAILVPGKEVRAGG